MRHAMPHPADSLRGTGELVNLTNSGYFSASPRWVMDGNAILFAERLHLHGGIGGVEGEHLIRFFLSHYA